MIERDDGFKVCGGEVFRLLHDHPHLRFSAGDQGFVWGVYDRTPAEAEYEADFYRADGTGVAMMFEKHEVELVTVAADIRIPREALEFFRRVE
jgi:hypothetical protein